MNRRSSTDSLDNRDVDVIGSTSSSSSPIDFTSDDEGTLDNYIGSLPTHNNLSDRKSLEDLYPSFSDERMPQTHLGYRHKLTDTRGRVRFHDKSGLIVFDPQTSWNTPLVDGQSGPSLGVGVQESSSTDRASSSRGINSMIMRMNAKLVECRSMDEAFEFVDQNRETIDDLTRIITHEAPSYRNYDMNDYQIDHSMKGSFNPSFWYDREPIVTTADGNCQYHAVSLSLTGTEAYTPEVRLATAVAVIDNFDWFDNMLKLIDRGTVLDLIRTISRSHSWGDETTLKAVAIAIKKRIFLYTCNLGKKDYEVVKSLSKEELIEAFRERKYRGGTGIHAYADPLVPVSANDYIMLFHKSEHFIAILPTSHQPVMYEPYIPIVPTFT